jgi:hypothetical protein
MIRKMLVSFQLKLENPTKAMAAQFTLLQGLQVLSIIVRLMLCFACHLHQLI